MMNNLELRLSATLIYPPEWLNKLLNYGLLTWVIYLKNSLNQQKKLLRKEK